MKKLVLVALMLVVFLVSPVMAVEKTGEVTWTQENISDVAGWKLYISQTSGVYGEPIVTIPYVEGQTEYVITQVLTAPEGQVTTFYCVMKSFDAAGNMSIEYSNELSVSVDLDSPTAPFILQFRIISE